jgi:hypothetical protein
MKRMYAISLMIIMHNVNIMTIIMRFLKDTL